MSLTSLFVIALVFIGLTSFAPKAPAQGGVPLWTNYYNGPANGNDFATGIAVDGTGKVFVSGSSYATNGSDYATIEYSSSISTPHHPDFQKLNNQLVLSWNNTGISLQSAPAAGGPYTNIPSAMSPYTNPISGAQQFYRLIQ
jgi:hypothetical protein